MTRLPSVSSTEIIRILRSVGFSEAPHRGKGSDRAFVRRDPTGPRLVVVPQGKDIPKGTLLAILEQAGMTREEFLGLR